MEPPGRPDIAGLFWQALDLDVVADGAPDRRHQVVDADRPAAGDVEHGAGRDVGVGRGEVRGHDVGHEGEVAHLLTVTEDRQRPPLADRGEEPVHSHVRALPRAVDGEVPQRHGRQTPVGRIEPAQVLGRELGDAVGAVRARQVVLAGRIRRRVAVDRRRRGVDDAPRLRLAGRFEHALGGEHVVPDVVDEPVRPRQPHARLPGEVEDHLGAVEQRRELGALQVGRLVPEAGVRGEPVEHRAFLVEVVVVGQAVDADDVVPGGECRLGKMPADEPRGTGDDYAHDRLSPVVA